MAFRVRKTIKLFPGVKLNLSKSGVSASIGPKGFTTNVKPGRKARTTVGLPGTRVSYGFTHDADKSALGTTPSNSGRPRTGILILLALAVLLVFVVKR